ncbi:hypothetical protein ACHAWU_004713 [Discostella pseudostelligera]|uniref:Uncharacterized protein n=1 Tax=Discostella pseudostelligera TaxID=259834 RepID=A0ABD3M6F7_9STRA
MTMTSAAAARSLVWATVHHAPGAGMERGVQDCIEIYGVDE